MSEVFVLLHRTHGTDEWKVVAEGSSLEIKKYAKGEGEPKNVCSNPADFRVARLDNRWVIVRPWRPGDEFVIELP